MEKEDARHALNIIQKEHWTGPRVSVAPEPEGRTTAIGKTVGCKSEPVTENAYGAAPPFAPLRPAHHNHAEESISKPLASLQSVKVFKRTSVTIDDICKLYCIRDTCAAPAPLDRIVLHARTPTASLLAEYRLSSEALAKTTVNRAVTAVLSGVKLQKAVRAVTRAPSGNTVSVLPSSAVTAGKGVILVKIDIQPTTFDIALVINSFSLEEPDVLLASLRLYRPNYNGLGTLDKATRRETEQIEEEGSERHEEPEPPKERWTPQKIKPTKKKNIPWQRASDVGRGAPGAGGRTPNAA